MRLHRNSCNLKIVIISKNDYSVRKIYLATTIANRIYIIQ
jgi:hypothetical protein